MLIRALLLALAVMLLAGSAPAAAACPAGYTMMSNGTCLKFVQPLVCPRFQRWTENGCVCNSGYVKLSNGNCVPFIPIPVCGPHQHPIAGGGCGCDTGYVKYNGNCVLLCPAGTHFQNFKCVPN